MVDWGGKGFLVCFWSSVVSGPIFNENLVADIFEQCECIDFAYSEI